MLQKLCPASAHPINANFFTKLLRFFFLEFKFLHTKRMGWRKQSLHAEKLWQNCFLWFQRDLFYFTKQTNKRGQNKLCFYALLLFLFPTALLFSSSFFFSSIWLYLSLPKTPFLVRLRIQSLIQTLPLIISISSATSFIKNLAISCGTMEQSRRNSPFFLNFKCKKF